MTGSSKRFGGKGNAMAIVYGKGKGDNEQKGATDVSPKKPQGKKKGFVGILDKAFDLLETTTKTDLDGDGVVGANPAAREGEDDA